MDIIEFIRDGSFTFKEVESPINGKLTVKWDINFGYQIMGGGLWQVGGPVRIVWKAAIEKVHSEKPIVKKALILGLGGGSIAKLIREYWPDASITGVDIDPVIVELGKDYLNLGKLDVDIQIDDALHFLKLDKTIYDLICVDTYVGDQFPPQFESEVFLNLLKKHMDNESYAVFNRLYFGDKRKIANAFEKTLESIFNKVNPIYPEAAALYLCQTA